MDEVQFQEEEPLITPRPKSSAAHGSGSKTGFITKLAIIVGTRPNFVKASAVLSSLAARGVQSYSGRIRAERVPGNRGLHCSDRVRPRRHQVNLAACDFLFVAEV